MTARTSRSFFVISFLLMVATMIGGAFFLSFSKNQETVLEKTLAKVKQEQTAVLTSVEAWTKMYADHDETAIGRLLTRPDRLTLAEDIAATARQHGLTQVTINISPEMTAQHGASTISAVTAEIKGVATHDRDIVTFAQNLESNLPGHYTLQQIRMKRSVGNKSGLGFDMQARLSWPTARAPSLMISQK